MDRLSKFTYPIIAIVLYSYLQWDYMANRYFTEFGQTTNGTISSIVLLVFFALCSIYCLSNKANLSNYERTFLYMYLGILFFSLLNTYQHPLQSGVLPIKIILPGLLFLFTVRQTELQDYGKFVKSSVVIAFLFLVYSNYTSRESVYSTLLSADEFISSASYVLLFVLPLMLCFDNKYVKWGSTALVAISLIHSFKRTGMISFSFGLFIYLFIYFKKNGLSLTKKVLSFFIIVLVCVYFANHFANDFFIERFNGIQEDGGSGRDDVYKKVFEMLGSTDLFLLFTGHGWDSVTTAIGMPAHNDYLELFYDCGIFVFYFFVRFLVKIVQLNIRLYKSNHNLAAPLAASIVIFLINSMISHIVLYAIWMLTFSVFWGYVIGTLKKEKFII